jgi:hypothetical protein
MITYDYDPEWAVTLFPYDHDCNPAQIMQAIQRGEELTYIRTEVQWPTINEQITFKAFTGEMFVPPHDEKGIYLPLLYIVWNAICERGYRMEKLGTGIIRFRVDYPEWYAQPMRYQSVKVV